MRMSYFFIIILNDFQKSCAPDGMDVRISGIGAIPISGFRRLHPLGVLISCYRLFFIECTNFAFSAFCLTVNFNGIDVSNVDCVYIQAALLWTKEINDNQSSSNLTYLTA